MMTGSIFLGTTPLRSPNSPPRGEFVEDETRNWYRISDFDQMPPFFMSITNPDDIWMFISSTGGITAGRTSKDHAVFPYSTVDKITESHAHSGSFTSLLVLRDEKTFLWEPLNMFSPPVYEQSRSIFKSSLGDSVVFEEKNRSLGLVFRVGWEASPQFGIHRFVSLGNLSDAPIVVRALDGIRNVLPAGATAKFQSAFSNLLDAYKRNESTPSGLGIFALSAAPTDLAEPSESLACTTVWMYGLEGSVLLLSDTQTDRFRRGDLVNGESDVKGRRGAYLRSATLHLAPGDTREWGFCAEVDQDHSAVVGLESRLMSDHAGLLAELQDDIVTSRARMLAIVMTNDGTQEVGSLTSKHHHTANVMFNLMRGGYFVEGYTVESRSFSRFVKRWNAAVYSSHHEFIESLPEKLSLQELHARCRETGDRDLLRLAFEYLPLTFSRRHGDPSRPWNDFFIRTRDEDGQPLIGYQGNWRDIFQNWEALCLSYPDYFPAIVCKFLNATTADGYNPYRISQDGIDWEVPEPDSAWSNIGYWGDHQIVYLSRLMEHAENFSPGTLSELLDESIFVFADVPYRIKPFDQILMNPSDTIDFDARRNTLLQERAMASGADGKLLLENSGDPIHATMVEKLLILLLTKASNYVPGGGIWLNTQRPEWNDANNALAGWGLSVVTLAYLIRFIDLLGRLVQMPGQDDFCTHVEVDQWLRHSTQALRQWSPESTHEPATRFRFLQAVGLASSDYRQAVYKTGLTDLTRSTSEEIESFLRLCRQHFVATLEETRLPDRSFESYQILHLEGSSAVISRLYPMLEGQVAGLSSGIVDPDEAIRMMDTLKAGPLYRKDQRSYMLYPNRDLAGFLQKNTIAAEAAGKLTVLTRPRSEWIAVLSEDVHGSWHFDSSFRNASDLLAATGHLPATERNELLELFEQIFNHTSFTGRSGTFFAFEGLGSIYWHMVSKLLLAVQEQLVKATLSGANDETVAGLMARYMDIRAGLGFNKSPAAYGAFPADPYSHTPWGQGAKQPGMTGQVKEEIVARYAELGLVVRDGRIRFLPKLILDDQWRTETDDFEFSFCGVPVLVTRAGKTEAVVSLSTGETRICDRLELPEDLSAEVFSRTGQVASVRVSIQG